MPVLIELQGFDELSRRMARYPQATALEVRHAMTTALTLMEADQRRGVAQDTRRLMTSITQNIEGTGTQLEGRVGPTLRYGFFVEYGRRPGRRPPVRAVAGWARRHGINPFVLARAIGRRGTRPQPFVAPSFTRNRLAIARIFGQVAVRMAGYVAGGPA